VTGPEHYREAERLLDASALRGSGSAEGGPNPVTTRLIAAAQVHATLALAAATIDAAELAPTSRYDGFYPDEAWEAVIGQ